MNQFHKNRLEAFSDGVLAIIITIMVLELRPPHETTLASLLSMTPVFMSYTLSFVFIAIYWNNHHHLLHTAKQINGSIMWANMHLLFWLSLVPFATAWMGESLVTAALPTALYGLILLMAGFAYSILSYVLIAAEGPNSLLAQAMGKDWKGKFSLLLYASAIGLAFVNPWLSRGLYMVVAVLWIIPDRRIEKKLMS
jgi:uncharacterized membrane protein